MSPFAPRKQRYFRGAKGDDTVLLYLPVLTKRRLEIAVRSPAFRRFFARIPAKAGTTNIGHFFPRAV